MEWREVVQKATGAYDLNLEQKESLYDGKSKKTGRLSKREKTAMEIPSALIVENNEFVERGLLIGELWFYWTPTRWIVVRELGAEEVEMAGEWFPGPPSPCFADLERDRFQSDMRRLKAMGVKFPGSWNEPS